MPGKKALLISLLLAILALGCYSADWMGCGWLESRLQTAGFAMRSRPELSFFPPAINIGEFDWQGRFHGLKLELAASELRAVPRLADLFQGVLAFEEIRINAPALGLSDARVDGQSDHIAASPLPAIEKLICQDGSIKWTCANDVLELSNLRMSVTNIKPREDLELQSDFILAYTGRGLPAVTSNMALRAKARYYTPNLSLSDLHATATLTEPATLGRLSPLTLELNGSMDLESGRCRLQAAMLGLPGFEINGNGVYQDGAFDGNAMLSTTRPLTFATSFKLASPVVAHQGSIQLPKLTASLDQCKGTGQAEIQFSPGRRPKLFASLRMGALQLPVSHRQSKRFKQIDLPQRAPLLDFDLAIAFTEIRRGEFRISLPDIKLAGNETSIELRQFSCQPGGGSLRGNGVAHFKQKLWRLAVNGENLPLGDLIRMGGIDGFSDGSANLDLRLALSTANGNFSLPSLAAKGSLDFQNLRLAFLEDIAALLPTLGPKSEFSDIIRKGNIGIEASNGHLSISPFLFKGPGIRGNGFGRIALADKTVQGELNLFLGRFEIPLAFSGPLDNPDISINSPLLKTVP